MHKILISAYTACPNRGSEPGNGWNWITQYNNNDYDVEVITSSRYKDEIAKYIYDFSLSVKFHFVDTPLYLKTLRVPILGEYIHYYLWLVNSRSYIKSQLKNIEFDFYHHVTYSSIKFGTPIYDLGKPTILGPMGGTEMPHKSLKKYFGKYWYAEIIKEQISNFLARVNPAVRKSIASSSKILVSNSNVMRFIEKYSPKSTEFMFDAGLPDQFAIPYPEKKTNGDITILWTGKFFPRKGLNLAIEAFSELLKINTNFQLVIIGDGPLRGQVKTLISKLNLSSHVRMLGTVSYEEIVNNYKMAHIFLFPSLKDSCPMQVFEAMACGLPVITLDHQGMHDQVVEGTGLKVGIQNSTSYPLELAKAIIKLSDDNALYDQFSRAAYSFGQKQLWSARIKVFLNNNLIKTAHATL